jgi:3-methyladenine DNA glycosylase AlkC
VAYADDLLGAHTVRELITAFAGVAPGLSLPNLAATAREAGTGTLRARSNLLRRALLADLPRRYADLAALVRATHRSPVLFRGWMLLPVTTAVAARARDDGGRAAYADAMDLLGELTGRFTSEFAVRPMLVHDLPRGLRIAQDWARSPDEDLRRLAAVGTRPYLPWAQRVPAILSDPGSTVPILDLLHHDRTEFVRRPVADHLADVARRDPHLALRVAARWLEDPDGDLDRLVARGLRRLPHAEAYTEPR